MLDSMRVAAIETPPIRRTYVEAMMLRARWHRRADQRLASTEAALRAWRANPDGFSNARKSWCMDLIEETCHQEGRLGPIACNRLLAEFVDTSEAIAIRRQFSAFPIADRVRLRYPKPANDPERQGDLILLKLPNDATGELGVLLIKYSEAFRRLAAVFDLAALASRYQIVLEPSWWGYQDATFLLYLGADLDTVILAQRQADYEFLEYLQSNLTPIRLGAGDWVDPDTFRSTTPPERRRFDVVMVAGWSPAKRHTTLFRALRDLKRRQNRILRVALIGYPQGWTREKIEALMRRFGVADQCTLYEGIPQQQVAEIVADARVSVVLSKREGANKALYESLFCDTPVVLLEGQRGVNLDHITSEVGVLTDESSLGSTLLSLLGDLGTFRPRKWADAHTGWQRSTDLLNQCLKRLAERRGRPWTTDIAAKKNAPNLRYARAGAYRAFENAYDGLTAFLL